MNDKDIELLLVGRKIIDSYMEGISTLDDRDSVQSVRHTEATDKMMGELTKLGFSVFQAFVDFNETMCLQAVEECRKYTGECDLCGGEIEQPPCFLKYREHSCFSNGGEHGTDGRIKRQWKQWANNEFLVQPWNDNGDISYFCPPGHGRYIKKEDWKEFPFDIAWSKQWRY